MKEKKKPPNARPRLAESKGPAGPRIAVFGYLGAPRPGSSPQGWGQSRAGAAQPSLLHPKVAACEAPALRKGEDSALSEESQASSSSLKAAGRSAPTSWRFAGGKKKNKKNHSTTSPTDPTESQCNRTKTHWLCPCWSRGSFSSSAPFCLKNKTMEGNLGEGCGNPAMASDFSLQCSLQPPAPKMVPTEMPGPFQCLKLSSPFFCWDSGSDHFPQPPVSSR